MRWLPSPVPVNSGMPKNGLVTCALRKSMVAWSRAGDVEKYSRGTGFEFPVTLIICAAVAHVGRLQHRAAATARCTENDQRCM